MDDRMKVRQGASLPLILTNDEEGGDTATLTVSQDGTVFLTKTASFTDLEADLTLTGVDTSLAVGEYEYMYTIVNDDGTIEKYPDLDSCTDCELPILEICEANDVEVS